MSGSASRVPNHRHDRRRRLDILIERQHREDRFGGARGVDAVETHQPPGVGFSRKVRIGNHNLIAMPHGRQRIDAFQHAVTLKRRRGGMVAYTGGAIGQ